MPLPVNGIVPNVKVRVGEPRPLTRDDVNSLSKKREHVGIPAKLRESHHMVARLVASGARNKIIAEHTGYSDMRIAQLRQSPAFQQLVSTYKAMIDGEFLEEADAYAKLAFGNMIAAERHIADHLADADEMGELIPIKTALAISRDAADRFGYGKRQTNLNVNVDFAAKLEDAIRRSGKLIDTQSSHGSSMVEQGPCKAQVVGSSPTYGSFAPGGSTISPPLAPAQAPSSSPLKEPAPLFRRRA